MNIELTAKGKAYIQTYLEPIYKAEEEALKETLEKFPQYIEANECYENALRKQLENEKKDLP